ncbi:hypothetical protein [Alkalicoccus daliensis]|uniref:Uncharacterized protein n=1 Tax=Alkalicoccus daliensis TaxID=745820 RepID=A0A1H0CXY3_9BACI|nr:hypothetical protein [Alkalicoccus daliensis]SDN62666.1 hypothetical protein SAMN04488053_102270 [Alkalicoccus daliensis]
MTFICYIAADVPLTARSYQARDLDVHFNKYTKGIKGFNLPLQIEIEYGILTKKELDILLDYLYEHADQYRKCTFQVANFINSTKHSMKVLQRKKVLLHQIRSPEELLLEEGELITIKKIPFIY